MNHPLLAIIFVMFIFMIIVSLIGLKIVSDREVNRFIDKYNKGNK